MNNYFISQLKPTGPTLEKVEKCSEASAKYMADKFEKMKMPSDEAVDLKPSRDNVKTMQMIPHLCAECIRANKNAKIQKYENGQSLSLRLCKMCSHNNTSERRPKFYNQDMLCFIRGLEGHEG